MKAIVCVKQVPDTSGKVAVKADGTLDRASMATITNPDDLNALEAALKLKDATGCEVVVITMGPPPAEGMLRELLARGADKAVLVSGREFGGSDTFATSQILAAAVNKIGVGPEDVVFCGRQAIDGDTAQVGPQIAEKLHLPQVTYVADIQKDGNTLTVNSRTYTLKQFHFHVPSENQIKGRTFPMEAHFVHLDENRQPLVLAVLYEAGKTNDRLAPIWNVMPMKEGKVNLDKAFDAGTLLPKRLNYYRFAGSLTPPPCSEGVSWLVLKTYDHIDQAQAEKFTRAIGSHNSRPVQPLNARVVIE